MLPWRDPRSLLRHSFNLSIDAVTSTTRAGCSVKLGNEPRKEYVLVFVKEEVSSGEHEQRRLTERLLSPGGKGVLFNHIVAPAQNNDIEREFFALLEGKARTNGKIGGERIQRESKQLLRLKEFGGRAVQTHKLSDKVFVGFKARQALVAAPRGRSAASSDERHRLTFSPGA